MEKSLAQKRKEIKNLNDRIKSDATGIDVGLSKAEERNKEFEIRFKASNEKITFLEKTILNREKELELLKEDIKQRIKQIEELKKLEIKIMEKDKDIDHLKTIIEQKNKQIDINKKDFMQQILNKDLEIEKFEEELKQSKKQLETKEKNFSEIVHKKNIEIEKLENDIEAKTIQLNEITNKFRELEIRISDEIQLSSKLIKKIEKLMNLKGFISDIEYKDLKEKLESQLTINH